MTELALRPSGGALGAFVDGLQLEGMPDESTAAELRRALDRYMVLVFPGQRLDEAAQIDFTRVFGRPVEHVRAQPERPLREIFYVSNIRRDGKPVGALGHDEIPFHSDLSYIEKPGTVSVLYAVEVPAVGGQTQWCNCCAAYEALDDETRRQLAGMQALHRHPVEAQNPPTPAVHPVVRLHPATGRRSIYVSPHLTRRLEGMDEAEGQGLLVRLFNHMERPEFVWTHAWTPGDLLVWDNRPTMHRRLPFPPDQRRLMRRTQVFNTETPQPG